MPQAVIFVASPYSYASLADTDRPVIIISKARDKPINCGNRAVEPLTIGTPIIKDQNNFDQKLYLV